MTPGQANYEAYTVDRIMSYPWEILPPTERERWERAALVMMNYGRFDKQKEMQENES